MKQNQPEQWEDIARKMGVNIPAKTDRKAIATTPQLLIPLAYLNLSATAHVADWPVAKWAFAALALIAITAQSIQQCRNQ